MKNRIRLFEMLLLLVVLLIGCKTARKIADNSTKHYQLSITNPSSIERVDELVVLTRAMIEAKTGFLIDGQFISIQKDNTPIVVQFDDLNSDGKWDEVAFLLKFEPGQKIAVTVTPTTSILTQAEVRAHVMMRKKNEDNTFGPLLDSVTQHGNTAPTDFTKQKFPLYLTEGPAWENDKVGFRLYMDTRNTKDIYGKTKPVMVMDTIGVNPSNSNGGREPWGMDILAVGKSLGAGSLAIQLPLENGKDTLVRLGGVNVGEVSYKKIADGPLRATFKMNYSNWTAVNNTSPIDITEEISIWGGKFFYQSRVTINNAPIGTKLVTGIVNLKSKKSNELSIEGCKVLYTYDAQSENKDKLGLGIMVQGNQFDSFGKTPNARSEIVNTYTVLMPVINQPVEYRFYSGWELSDLLFTREESFKKFLQNEALKYTRPLIIAWN